jgi:capsular polysaccharide transport system permease protein
MSTSSRVERYLFLAIVVVPLTVGLLYFLAFATDRYASTAQVTVRQSGSGDTPMLPGLATMLSGTNPTSREETLYLREFVTSYDMLRLLQKELKWSDHYAGRLNDPIFWLGGDASQEDLLEYFRRMVKVSFDDQTGLLAIEVQAFERKFAEETLRFVLSESETFVNELSHKMAREQMRFAQNELSNARRSYVEFRDKTLAFQETNGLLDAQATAKSRASSIAELEGSLTRERANLRGMLAGLSSDSPQVRQQIVRIRSLEQQADAEAKKLVSSRDGNQINKIAAQYRNLLIDEGIAEEAYKYSVSAVESARIEASKKIRTLVVVTNPNLPDDATYPRVAYNLITLTLGLLAIYGIVRFVVATINDHKD